MDVTRTMGFGRGRKRKAPDWGAIMDKRRAKAAAKAAKKAKRKQVTCYCDAYPYPHRKGSENAPSSTWSQQKLHYAQKSPAAMRGRLRRLLGFAKKRDAARWGWNTGGAAPF